MFFAKRVHLLFVISCSGWISSSLTTIRVRSSQRPVLQESREGGST
jgi:hypothetical protein